MDWNEWFRSAQPRLRTGHEVFVPPGLPHPATMGFRRPFMAEPWGQRADWVFSLPDRSRLHLHEFDGGVLVAHIDETDPSLGTARAVYHWGTESASGRTALFTAMLWLLLRFRP